MNDKLLAESNTCLLQRWSFICLLYCQILFLKLSRSLFNRINRYDNLFLLNCCLPLFECIIHSSSFGLFISWQTWQNGRPFECLNSRLLKNRVLNIFCYSFLLARVIIDCFARLYLYHLNSETEFLICLMRIDVMVEFIVLFLVAIINH